MCPINISFVLWSTLLHCGLNKEVRRSTCHFELKAKSELFAITKGKSHKNNHLFFFSLSLPSATISLEAPAANASEPRVSDPAPSILKKVFSTELHTLAAPTSVY